jgi:sterol 14-demethylase
MLEPLIQKVTRKKTPIPAGLKAPPRLSGGVPVIGHTVEFVRSTIGLLHRAHEELGEIAEFEVMGRRMVALYGADGHEAVFRAPEDQLSPQEAYKIMTPIFGKGMVYDAPQEKMNEQLKMLLPALKDRRMRTYGEIVVQEVEESIASWGDKGELDLVEYCRVLTNYTSSHCLLGKEFRGSMNEEFASVYTSLERGITPLAYINANLPIPSFRERDRARIRLEEMVTKIIEQRRHSQRKGEDFLQTLMDAKYKGGAPLTEHEITGMLVASMFAGHHTSSVTTAWAIIELAKRPDLLARVRAELDGVFGDGTVPGFHTLRSIPLTEGVVLETLRLHPPLFMLVRVAEKDFTYKGYFIPKGAWVIVSPTVSHLIPEHFKDPTAFDPDRYGPGREEDKKDFAFIPFGGGRHKCMGNAFAILQVKAILTILLRRFDFELESPNVESDFHGLVVGPKEPCRVRYKKREGVTHFQYTGKGANAGAAALAPQKFKVEVDLDLCQGHAVCQGEAPEVFRVSGVGKVELINAFPDPELYGKSKMAEKYCPTKTIRITELS